MSVFGIALVKDEADFFKTILDYMIGNCDHVIVADNGSTDGTREIIAQSDAELVDDPEVPYYQSRKMSALAERAGSQGAEWIVPFDADELWQSRYDCLKVGLEALPREVMVADAALFDYVPTPEGCRKWRRLEPIPFRKVAFRYRPGVVVAEGNHSVRYRDVALAPAALDYLVVRHHPYRSIDQFLLKARNGGAAYADVDESVPSDAGVHKRRWGTMTEQELRDEFTRSYWVADPPNTPGLVEDPW